MDMVRDTVIGLVRVGISVAFRVQNDVIMKPQSNFLHYV